MYASRLHTAALFVATTILGVGITEAHPTIQSGPAFANKTQKLVMGLSHGCDGADTLSIKIDIPVGISSAKPLYSDFGKPSITRDGANAINSIKWQKPGDVLAEDFAFHELTIRARVGDVPFTKVFFTITQVCRDAAGVETTVIWDQPPGSTTGEPAAPLNIVPARQAGWNKYTLGATAAVAEADLATFFGDAQIVWRGNAAYSSNANTMALIAGTAGVTALTGGLQANDEIWVKY